MTLEGDKTSVDAFLGPEGGIHDLTSYCAGEKLIVTCMILAEVDASTQTVVQTLGMVMNTEAPSRDGNTDTDTNKQSSVTVNRPTLYIQDTIENHIKQAD